MKTYTLIILLTFSISAKAQKQGNKWYFGTGAGLDFSSGTPIVITGGKTGTDFPPNYNNQEGSAAISDSAVNLLLYTGGARIWNKQHNVMPNGSGILGGVSSSQSSLIVPKPGTDNLFFVFTSDEFQNYYSPRTQSGYRYSVVDICLDSARGDVLTDQKNILLLDSSSEKLAACEDANGNGYWVLGHKMFSEAFYAWHLTATGISGPVISHTGTYHGRWSYFNQAANPGSAQGQLKFNPQGTKLALALGNYDPSIIDIFDFDKNTGTVSNFCHIAIDSILGKRAFGIEFSPDGSKVYAPVSGGYGGQFLYQYDLNAGDCNSITASGIKIFESTRGGIFIAGMQLAPDNKIYTTFYGSQLGCIRSPNLAGLAADFDSAAIDVSPALSSYSLTSLIAGYKYHNRIPCDPSLYPPPVITPVTPIDYACDLDIKTNIYPNPFGRTLIVDKKETLCKVTMRLYNVLGQLIIKDREIKEGVNEIQLSALATGVYYYKFISSEKRSFTGTIVKH